jgi:glycosyltransferase involved in cell wall biosynthesis
MYHLLLEEKLEKLRKAALMLRDPYMLGTSSFTRKLPVAVSSPRARYVRTIYNNLQKQVHTMPWSPGIDFIQSVILDKVEQFHLHWPEWFLREPHSLDLHQHIIEKIKKKNIRLIWTQHNLLPHIKTEEFFAIYQAWAQATDIAIHHSKWGQDLVRSQYDFSASCKHLTIPHPHWSDLKKGRFERTAIEQEFGIPPCNIRLGIVGSPREEKDVTGFMRAFAECNRQDMQLVVWSLKGDEEIVSDPRIFGKSYSAVDLMTYNKRLAIIDLLVLPFSKHTMLTTGTAADAISMGLPCLTSNWPYLEEYLRDAAIVYGSSHGDIVQCLESLNDKLLINASTAARSLQQDYSPERIAEITWSMLSNL